MRKLTLAIAFAVAALGVSAIVGSAQALPISASGALQSAAGDVGAAEQVRMVCNRWGRCWWVPGPRYYGPGYGIYRPGPRYYGPRWRYRRW